MLMVTCWYLVTGREGAAMVTVVVFKDLVTDRQREILGKGQIHIYKIVSLMLISLLIKTRSKMQDN